MMAVRLTLDFACGGCCQDVKVTVQCSGKGLQAALDPVATVNVPCPTCGQINQLTFEPNGLVHGVRLYAAPRQVPQPSLN